MIFEIVVELGFGEDLDALIVGCDRAHHSLPPPVLANPLRNDRAGTIESVERYRDVLVKLRSMVCRSVANFVHDLLWHAVGVLVRLHERRRNRADEHRLCDPALAVRAT